MRIGIVNDIVFAAEALRRVIASGSRYEIAWIARSGEEAIARCASDRPDVVLMDLIMPGMDGVEATRRIMTATPCAIVVVSGNINDDSAKVFEAMGAGALDAVNTPAINAAGKFDRGEPLIRKLDMIRKLIGRGQEPGGPAVERVSASDRLVAIGASAGGPAALARVLSGLPRDFNAAIIIVQHVDPQFAPGLATWLDHHSPLPVRLAEEGDHPQTGVALVAAREQHLVFTGHTRLGYTRVPAETSFRPSVDVFFKSVVHHWKGAVVGVLLTGMGRDGAEGLRLLKEGGHRTIAQDRQTSAVFGMPKAAADLHAATEILALDKIGPRLSNIFAVKQSR
jgi:chemotaxis response regulator CheB